MYADFGAKVGDSDEHFLLDPAVYEYGSTPAEKIQKALDGGAAIHDPSELKTI
jgi:hypothetical protein